MDKAPATEIPVALVGCGAISRFFYVPTLKALAVPETLRVAALVDPSTQNLNRWHGLDWTSDLVFSTNKNQIVALQSGLTAAVGSGRWVGQPINVY